MGKRKNPQEEPAQTPIHPPQIPYGVTEMQTWDPSSEGHVLQNTQS